MAKNKLDAVNFCRIFDMFGEDAAKVHIPQELRIRSGGTERHSASN